MVRPAAPGPRGREKGGDPTLGSGTEPPARPLPRDRRGSPGRTEAGRTPSRPRPDPELTPAGGAAATKDPGTPWTGPRDQLSSAACSPAKVPGKGWSCDKVGYRRQPPIATAGKEARVSGGAVCNLRAGWDARGERCRAVPGLGHGERAGTRAASALLTERPRSFSGLRLGERRRGGKQRGRRRGC